MLTPADVEYIRAGFIPLDELCRDRGYEPAQVHSHIDAGRLPRPSYVLDDGTEMVPHDYFDLAEEAGGTERLREEFMRRYSIAASREQVALEPPEAEWEAYLSGEYGVCLRAVTPETIVRKSALVAELDTLLSEPRPEDTGWAARLQSRVGELDELEREFAPSYDRIRFGGPSSRDRLITAARERYPDLFRPASDESAA